MNKSLHKLFHTLWTKAVVTTSYIKEEWLDLEQLILKLKDEHPQTIILRDDDDNFLIGKFQREFRSTDKSIPVPEYKLEQFWNYSEARSVEKELE